MAERALRLPSAYAYGYITDRVRYQIDANSIGGIARFLPHLPTSADIIRKNIERMALRDDPRMNSLRGMSENAFQEAIQALFVRFYGDTQFELESISFSDNVRKEVIATENVKFYTVNFQGNIILMGTALRDISVGEVLGFSYGHNYWTASTDKMQLMKRNGELLPISDYPRFRR